MMTGGGKADAYLSGLASKIASAKEVRVGFLEGATYDDGTPVAMVAAIQEYGAPSKGIPPRPFMRPTVANHSGEWPDQLAKTMQHFDYDAEKSLDAMGSLIGGEIRQAIVDVTAPPLKPATIKRKGFDKPLIETGHMLGSVNHEVMK